MISAVESSPSSSSISKITTPKNLLSEGASGSVKVSQNVVIATITAFSRRERARACFLSYLLADSRLHLDPGAGRRFGLERTGEQMLGWIHRHTDAKKWHLVCARPLIQDERDELVYHCVPVITPSADQDRSNRSALASWARRGADSRR